MKQLISELLAKTDLKMVRLGMEVLGQKYAGTARLTTESLVGVQRGDLSHFGTPSWPVGFCFPIISCKKGSFLSKQEFWTRLCRKLMLCGFLILYFLYKALISYRAFSIALSYSMFRDYFFNYCTKKTTFWLLIENRYHKPDHWWKGKPNGQTAAVGKYSPASLEILNISHESSDSKAY